MYSDEINSLKYINEQVYRGMIAKINKVVLKKEKEQWEILIEDFRKLD